MKAKVSTETKYQTCSRGLARILKKLRDFYVKSLTEWAHKMESGFGPVAVSGSTLTKSFSMSSRTLSSGEQDLAELVRIASQRGLTEKVESEFLSRQQPTHGGVRVDVQHRRSVGMGKIDEDKAFDIVGIGNFNLDPIKYPRSKSHVVSRSSRI